MSLPAVGAPEARAEPRSDGPTESRAPLLLGTALSLIAFLLLLAHFYESRLGVITTKLNVWFGLDVPLFSAAWMVGDPVRAHWHPLAFALYAVYGRLLSPLVDATQASLVVLSLPVIVLEGIAIAAALVAFEATVEARAHHLLLLVAALAIGPVWLLAPVADTHMAGGVALLLCAVYVQRSFACEGRCARRALLVGGACGIVAGGFSVTNVGPAAILIGASVVHARLGAPAFDRRSRRALVAVLAVTVAAAALVSLVAARQVAFERAFMGGLSVQGLRDSIRALVVFQFGVPATALQVSGDPIAPVRGIGPLPASPFLSLAALGAWSIAVAVWLRRRARRAERWLVAALATATVALVLFHSVYATYEAYMFAPHCWFALILPAWIVLARPRATRSLEGRLMLVAIACSAAQSVFGLVTLVRELALY